MCGALLGVLAMLVPLAQAKLPNLIFNLYVPFASSHRAALKMYILTPDLLPLTELTTSGGRMLVGIVLRALMRR